MSFKKKIGIGFVYLLLMTSAHSLVLGTSVMGGDQSASGLTPKALIAVLEKVENFDHFKINALYTLEGPSQGTLVMLELNSLNGPDQVCEGREFLVKLDISHFPSSIEYKVDLVSTNNECQK